MKERNFKPVRGEQEMKQESREKLDKKQANITHDDIVAALKDTVI